MIRGDALKIRTVMRSALSSYMIFGGIGAICVLAALLDGLWTNVIVSIGLLICLLWWIGSYRIVIQGSVLTYKSIIGSFSVDRNDIINVRPTYFLRSSGPAALRLDVKDGTNKLNINLKPFSRSDIAAILAFFGTDLH